MTGSSPQDPTSNRGYYLDRAYENKVKCQQYAIQKALPSYLARQLGRPFKKEEADRLVAFYRTAMEKTMRKKIKSFDFGCYLRITAERQCRWQGKPDQALDMLGAFDIEEEVKAIVVELLEKPRRVR